VGLWLGLHRRQAEEPVIPDKVNSVVQQESVGAMRDAPLTFVRPSAAYESISVVPSAQEQAKVPSSAQVQARIDTVLTLAQNSPSEALRWAKSLPAGERPLAVIAAANEAARATPADALEALAELEPSSERDTALAHAASQWAALDPQGAVEWAAAGVPGELREQICSSVAISIASADPPAAAEFVATQMRDGVSLRTAAISVVQRWAQQDARAATGWVEEFPAGALRDEALGAINVQQRLNATTE
jgi:hypothetical protein